MLLCGIINGSAIPAPLPLKNHRDRNRNKKDHDVDAKRRRLRLLLFEHASVCTVEPKGRCHLGARCARMKALLKHIRTECSLPTTCPVEHCVSTRRTLFHFRDCQEPTRCPVCAPVRKALAKRNAATNATAKREDDDVRREACAREGVERTRTSSFTISLDVIPE